MAVLDPISDVDAETWYRSKRTLQSQTSPDGMIGDGVDYNEPQTVTLQNAALISSIKVISGRPRCVTP